MSEVDDILETLERQVTSVLLEPCSPVEDRLANALAVLIATLRHERAQKPDMGTDND